MRLRVGIILFAIFASCGSGNQYGYAREYEPLSEEEDFFEKAETVNYEDLRRDPEAFKGKLVSWFGLVTNVEKDRTGKARVSLDLRFHQDRHLCFDQFDSSCRVTISERSGGPFTAILDLRAEDAGGEGRLYEGSLLRVYGRANGDFDEQGGPILVTRYYRHWPRNTFVTTALQTKMRR
ncbi:MAG: hypothetical protein JXA30_18840 [Deltaproteobacteria bacterium]|nr:hypothetical protein [Deltaproteobacteria bacterium]